MRGQYHIYFLMNKFKKFLTLKGQPKYCLLFAKKPSLSMFLIDKTKSTLSSSLTLGAPVQICEKPRIPNA